MATIAILTFTVLAACVPWSADAQSIPNAPSNLVATAVSGFQINLSWSDTSTNEDGFKVERSLDGTNFTQIAQLLPNTTVYWNAGLFLGTTYFYRVRSYNSMGDSGSSGVTGTSTLTLCPTGVAAWGDNTFGESSTPAGLSNVVAVAGGYYHTLALRSDGTVVGWGNNGDGEAIPPAGLSGVVAITGGGFFSLALQNNGTIVGWGINNFGQISPPAGLSGVVAISAGFFHSLALQSDGTVVGWGNNAYGQAVPPIGLSGVVAISAGYSHSLALESDGTVVAWGDMGLPAGLTNIIAISAGRVHSLALRSDGTVVGWGDNSYGEATPPAGLSGVVAIAAGGYFSLALRSDGTVVGWGYNDNGDTTPPSGLSGALTIAASNGHSLALVVAIDAPAGLIGIAISSNQVNLAWTINGFPDGFNIQRAPDVGGNPGSWQQVGTVGSGVTNFIDIEVTTNTTYWYRVQSFNTCSTSNLSNLAIVDVTPPAAPSALVAVVSGANQVNLSWVDNSVGEFGFYIERALDAAGSPGVWIQIGTVYANTTTYSDTTVSTNSAYWYRVRAYNGLGNSPYSGQVFVNAGVPIAPSGLTAIAVDPGTIDLSWTDNSNNETSFKVERALDNHGTPGAWAQIISLGNNVTNYANSGLSPNTIYWYRVRASNGSGNSPYSNVADTTTPGPPFAPSNLVAVVVASNQVNLSWIDNSSTENGFEIDRARGMPFNLNITEIVDVGSNVTSYTDTGLIIGSTLYYQVTAFNSYGNSATTPIISVTIPSLPAGPSGLTATTVTTNEINLSWTDNSNNEGVFKIERTLDNGGAPGSWSQIATASTNVISYSDTGLAAMTRYWYRVRASNASGDSPYSNVADATTGFGTNVWVNTSGDKWETGANWSQGAPSISQALVAITNANSKVVGIDAVTAASNAVNGCLAIGDLRIFSPPGTTNMLSLANTGQTNPLHVVNSLIVTNGGMISITNAALQVDGAFGLDGSFVVQPDSQVVMSNASLFIGSVAIGQVTMNGGAMNVGTLVVASNAFSSGTFTMTGGSLMYSSVFLGIASNTTASAWLTGGKLFTTNRIFSLTIGGFGSAQMTISNGATLSSWITRIGTGSGAVGTLTMTGGSADLGSLSVGSTSNSTAAVWVSGGQLTATNQGLSVGNSSVGQLTISNGAVIAGSQVGGLSLGVGGNFNTTGTLTMYGGTLTSVNSVNVVAFSTGSSGSVWINGGTVTITNASAILYLGLQGSGQWTLTNGIVAVANLLCGGLNAGTLTVAGGSFSVLSNTTVGLAGNATGTVAVTGGQLVAPNGPFVLGNFSPCTMTVSTGTAAIRSMIISSNNAASTSTLNISGGQVMVFDSLVVGDCASNAIGQITVNGGTLYVTNATHTGYIDLRDGTLTVSGGGALVADRLVMTNACGLFVRNGGSMSIGSETLDSNLSAVGDGIPNGWKQQYGLDPLDPNLSRKDSDGDGMNNLQEFLAGMDPTNSVSYFHITSVVNTGSNVFVSWMTGIGKTNALQATNGGYATNSFTDIFTVTNTVGTTTNYLDVGGATNKPARFYRVRLVP